MQKLTSCWMSWESSMGSKTTKREKSLCAVPWTRLLGSPANCPRLLSITGEC